MLAGKVRRWRMRRLLGIDRHPLVRMLLACSMVVRAYFLKLVQIDVFAPNVSPYNASSQAVDFEGSHKMN